MAKTFKTLAEFKRVLAVGDKLHCMNHVLNKDMGIREVSIKQSNMFALKTPNTNGGFQDQWLEYPKASSVRIENDNTLVVLRVDTNTPALTYKLVD